MADQALDGDQGLVPNVGVFVRHEFQHSSLRTQLG